MFLCPTRILSTFALLCCAVAALARSDALMGYIREVPPEPEAAQEARHKRVAERRAGPAVICHRGASAFAPENTLESYAAAVDYGADGVEIDIRRSSDGVLYCFHDPWLDRMTDGLGGVTSLAYRELLSYQPRPYGTASADTRVPTLAAVLALARQRAMLLHLDVKEPGLEDDLARILGSADMWDHVICINDYNAEDLRKNPSFRPLGYKAPGLFEDCTDVDPAAVRAALAGPGEMIIVDDPRVAARELKRPAYKPVPLPDNLREKWTAPLQNEPQAPAAPDSPRRLESLAAQYESEADLVALLKTDLSTRNDISGDEQYQARRAAGIWNRAWAAHRLAQKRCASNEAICWLEYQIKHASLHYDLKHSFRDGCAAVAALARLGAVESAEVLIERFRTTPPEVQALRKPEARHPLSWYDGGKRDIIRALGDLRCEQSKRFLGEYVSLDDESLWEMGYPRLREAAESLMRQGLTRDEIISLLKNPHSEVRGAVVLYCLDHPSKEGDAALRSAAPWALELPRARTPSGP